jgi:hypothetical protein
MYDLCYVEATAGHEEIRKSNPPRINLYRRVFTLFTNTCDKGTPFEV